MSEERVTGSPDLWTVSLPEDRGPEGNVRLWRDAERILDGFCAMLESGGYGGDAQEWEGAQVALTEAFNRCKEEHRRAIELLELHRVWESRRGGGAG